MTMNSRKTLEKKQLKSLFWRSFTTSHAWHYERQQHMAFEFAMIPVINKLYDKNEEFDTSSISAMKVALMGPLAGIGDSLIGGTLRVIATGIVAGLCMSGSLLGPILFLLIYNIPTILLRYFGVKFGYGLGNTLISKLSEGDLMKKLTMAMAIVGLMVIGAMVAMTVAVTTPIAFNINDTAFSLQETLDSIFPCLLPMAVTLGLYKLNKKHVSVLVQVIGIMVLGIVLGAIGILG